MIAFIDDHREVHGVEPICKVLPIAPSTYYAYAAKRADPEKLSARARRDMALKPQIARVFVENFEVYGVRKVWRQSQRESFAVARSTIERLMRGMGLQGVIRGRPVRTTISEGADALIVGQGCTDIAPCSESWAHSLPSGPGRAASPIWSDLICDRHKRPVPSSARNSGVALGHLRCGPSVREDRTT